MPYNLEPCRLPILPESPVLVRAPPPFIYIKIIVCDFAEQVSIKENRVTKDQRKMISDAFIELMQTYGSDSRYTIHFLDDMDYSLADVEQPIWVELPEARRLPWDEIIEFQGLRYLPSGWKHVAYPILKPQVDGRDDLWVPFEFVRVDTLGNIDIPSFMMQRNLFHFFNQPDRCYKRVIIRRREASLIGSSIREGIFAKPPPGIFAGHHANLGGQNNYKRKRRAAFAGFQRSHRKIKAWRKRFSHPVLQGIFSLRSLPKVSSEARKEW